MKPNDDIKEMGARIRRLLKWRKRKGVWLASQCGVKPNTVWRWLDGRAEPSHEHKKAIADALGVSLAKIAAGD